jgi:hypothetical protein
MLDCGHTALIINGRSIHDHAIRFYEHLRSLLSLLQLLLFSYITVLDFCLLLSRLKFLQELRRAYESY